MGIETLLWRNITLCLGSTAELAAENELQVAASGDESFANNV
jgi:hypothetical protein